MRVFIIRLIELCLLVALIANFVVFISQREDISKVRKECAIKVEKIEKKNLYKIDSLECVIREKQVPKPLKIHVECDECSHITDVDCNSNSFRCEFCGSTFSVE